MIARGKHMIVFGDRAENPEIVAREIAFSAAAGIPPFNSSECLPVVGRTVLLVRGADDGRLAVLGADDWFRHRRLHNRPFPVEIMNFGDEIGDASVIVADLATGFNNNWQPNAGDHRAKFLYEARALAEHHNAALVTAIGVEPTFTAGKREITPRGLDLVGDALWRFDAFTLSRVKPEPSPLYMPPEFHLKLESSNANKTFSWPVISRARHLTGVKVNAA